MTVIRADLDGFTPAEPVRDAGPYTLKVTSAEDKEVTTKQGDKRVILEILLRILESGLKNPKLVRYTLWMPHAGQTAEQKNAAQGQIIRFKKACGIEDYEDDDIDTSEILGAEFDATLKLIEDSEYGDKNEIRRILA